MPKDSLLIFRLKAGYRTQAEAARRAGVSQQTWSKYESGQVTPEPKRQRRIAERFGFEPDAIWPQEEAVS